MRKVVLIMTTLLAFGTTSWAMPLYDVTCVQCGEYCSGCCEGAGCAAGGDSCVIVCSPPRPPGGTCPPDYPAPCGVGMRQLPNDTVTLTAANVPLESTLGTLSEAAGIPVIAPSVKGLSISLAARQARMGEVLEDIARQVRAVPVFRSSLHAIELVPRRELSARVFSLNAQPLNAKLRVEFNKIGITDAVRTIATAAGVDIIIPSGLSGKVSGSYGEMSWQNLLETVLLASGNPARVQVSSNGLVRISP